jgi:2-ketoarginine methyltransferase
MATATPDPSLPPARLPGVDRGFEQRLADGIRPISELFLACSLHHLFSTGVYDALARRDEPQDIGDLADELDLDTGRLGGFLRYLANEGIVTVDGDHALLCPKAHSYAEFRSWYTFLVGGYATTAQQLGQALRRGSDFCTRNGRDVGVGSCEIARYDGMPMTQTLLADAAVRPRCILDLGCGDALYLIDMCRRMPDATAWGAEPDEEAFKQAQAHVEAEGLQDRIRLVNTSAQEFLAAPPAECAPDTIVFGYVLQEVLGQQGEETVVGMLRSVVSAFPRINIVVIEVADEVANPSVMRHALARNFWNIYYLVHSFTNQRLESRAFWERLFEKAGLVWHGLVTTPVNADSTGVELGYLLRGPEWNA